MRMSLSHFSSYPERCEIAPVRALMTGDMVHLAPVFGDAANDPTLKVIEVDDAYVKAQMERGAFPSAHGFVSMSCRCTVCVPMRTLVQEFAENVGHRKVMQRNAHLTVSVHDGVPSYEATGSFEHARLHHDYMRFRFPLSSDTPHDVQAANEWLADMATYPGMAPHYIDMRDDTGTLRGSAVFHTAGKISYGTGFFYDPALRADYIGLALSLATLRHLRQEGFEHQYLGAVTRLPSPFSWKDKFTPMDLLLDGRWQRYASKAEFRPLRLDTSQAYPAPRR